MVHPTVINSAYESSKIEEALTSSMKMCSLRSMNQEHSIMKLENESNTYLFLIDSIWVVEPKESKPEDVGSKHQLRISNFILGFGTLDTRRKYLRSISGNRTSKECIFILLAPSLTTIYITYLTAGWQLNSWFLLRGFLPVFLVPSMKKIWF